MNDSVARVDQMRNSSQNILVTSDDFQRASYFVVVLMNNYFFCVNPLRNPSQTALVTSDNFQRASYSVV